MSLTLYYHPLSSFCWKALIGLYENEVPFDPVLVNLGDPDSRAAFLAVWPAGKFPVLVDTNRDEAVVPEATVILEYLDAYHAGAVRFVPAKPEGALAGPGWPTGSADLHMHVHMQRIVADRLRPAADKDPVGVRRGPRQPGRGLRPDREPCSADAGLAYPPDYSFGMADCAGTSRRALLRRRDRADR